MKNYKFAVLVSGKGSTFRNLIDCCNNGKLDGEICCAISNNSQAKASVIAEEFEIPYYITSDSRSTFEIIRRFEVDLVLLAGYNQYLTVPDDFQGKILNIHPSLLPEFGGKGYHGIRVHEAVLKAKKKETGCTVHVVDEEYDHGPIIAQQIIQVSSDDNPETLQKKVQVAERELYPKAIQHYIKRLKDDGKSYQTK